MNLFKKRIVPKTQVWIDNGSGYLGTSISRSIIIYPDQNVAFDPHDIGDRENDIRKYLKENTNIFVPPWNAYLQKKRGGGLLGWGDDARQQLGYKLATNVFPELKDFKYDKNDNSFDVYYLSLGDVFGTVELPIKVDPLRTKKVKALAVSGYDNAKKGYGDRTVVATYLVASPNLEETIDIFKKNYSLKEVFESIGLNVDSIKSASKGGFEPSRFQEEGEYHNRSRKGCLNADEPLNQDVIDFLSEYFNKEKLTKKKMIR
ncbi:MAG: hypothetical protein KJ697_01125 [Nanoarchaeota archaeon]|nr:hypothetical protein [Nanoarchaeota archaeon]